MAVIDDQIHENNTLYDDIIEQILPSLPVKSLLRFKTVCKSWYNLISNPMFANNNLACCDHNVSRIHVSGYNSSYRVETGELELAQLRNKVRGKDGLPWYFSVPSNGANCSDFQVDEFVNPFTVPLSYIDVVGSCNGLLFVIVENEPFLWNPSIREHVKLPPPETARDLECDPEHMIVAGLGYNSTFDEYKAVLYLVGDMWNHHIRNARAQLLIYSSRAGSWKEVVQGAPYCFCKTNDSGITVNDYPHWIVHDCKQSEYSKPVIIMYFDTVDDEFKRLPTPERWRDFDPSLGVLRRCLCATGKNLIDNTTDVWVMNEYGVEDSWTKLFVIPLSIICESTVPVGFMNQGNELVLEVGFGKIMNYNSKTEEQKFVIGTNANEFKSMTSDFGSVEYVTSLVSPCRLLPK